MLLTFRDKCGQGCLWWLETARIHELDLCSQITAPIKALLSFQVRQVGENTDRGFAIDNTVAIFMQLDRAPSTTTNLKRTVADILFLMYLLYWLGFVECWGDIQIVGLKLVLLAALGGLAFTERGEWWAMLLPFDLQLLGHDIKGCGLDCEEFAIMEQMAPTRVPWLVTL